ncbi:helix-turn-helix transcriptional regulator [Sphaerisporangium sp. NPDC051011]|uniref:helix-turn-helix domain-containing protein n=1 Tax=Sphaerisporangium sp. NPDC051011 TaxID=3155792 RepID=UPI0033CBC0DE
MPQQTNPTIRQRRLAAELERLREAAGFTREEIAERLDWHATKVWRVESGRSGISTGDLRDLLDIYQVNGPRRDALIALARHVRQKGWWTEYRDVLTGSYLDLEAQASMMRTYEPQLIPGLLQTEAYARAVVRAALVMDPKEVRRRTEARMARQQLLAEDRDGPQLWVVLEEVAVQRPVGEGDTMREQLQRLIAMSEHPRVTIQVIRTSAGAHPGLSGPFVLLDFPAPEFFAPIVYLETAASGLYLEETEEVLRYTLMFDHLRAIALGPAESVKFIQSIQSGLGSRE